MKLWIESEESNDEDDRSYYLTSAKKLINDLNKYIGYDFYFEDEVKE